MLHSVLVTGFDMPDVVSLLLRVLLGAFFILARFRWFYDPSRPNMPWMNDKRHEHMILRLCTCGYGTHPAIAAFVACVEVSAGVALIIGLLTIPATLGLLGVLLFATFCTAYQKVCEQGPVDCIDCVSCYLWRVEGVYIAIAFSILAMGPGAYSIDKWVF
jgi:uncharacterized membrane protein YphA (DoxX/SURF4 family)